MYYCILDSWPSFHIVFRVASFKFLTGSIEAACWFNVAYLFASNVHEHVASAKKGTCRTTQLIKLLLSSIAPAESLNNINTL